MPIFANLMTWLFNGVLSFFSLFITAKYALRMTAVTFLAGIYLSCVYYYTTMIGPWLASVFSTAYGQFIGLLFPPISGTVLAGLSAYWICVIGVRYTSTLTKMALG